MIDRTPEIVKEKASLIMDIAVKVMLALSIVGLALKILFTKNDVLQNIAETILTIAVYTVAISPVIVASTLLLFYILIKRKEGILLSLGILIAIGFAALIAMKPWL